MKRRRSRAITVSSDEGDSDVVVDEPPMPTLTPNTSMSGASGSNTSMSGASGSNRSRNGASGSRPHVQTMQEEQEAEEDMMMRLDEDADQPQVEEEDPGLGHPRKV